jgi:hypothetical protein
MTRPDVDVADLLHKQGDRLTRALVELQKALSYALFLELPYRTLPRAWQVRR